MMKKIKSNRKLSKEIENKILDFKDFSLRFRFLNLLCALENFRFQCVRCWVEHDIVDEQIKKLLSLYHLYFWQKYEKN